MLLLSGLLFAQNTGQDRAVSGGGAESQLRERVESFYGYLQLGARERAAELVSPEGRERFRSTGSSPFISYEVTSVQLEADGKKASVSTRLMVVAPFARGPVPLEARTTWQLEESGWYLLYDQPRSSGMDAFKSSKPTPPAPPDLKFKGHRWNFATIKPGQIKVARFPFTNVSDHAVRVSVNTGCDCLKAKLVKNEYKPGESGEIAIEFDPMGREFDYLQTIIVKTDPGQKVTYLNVHGFIEKEFKERKVLEAPNPATESKPRP